jgi:predicted extracellular nuclease
MMNVQNFFTVFSLLLLAIGSGPQMLLGQNPYPASAAGQKKVSNSVVFYNVENLFDTLDDPNKKDEDFTPGSELQWSHARYEAKLDGLTKVLLAAGDGQPPLLIGLAEVENAAVVEALGQRISREVAARSSLNAQAKNPKSRGGAGPALLYEVAHVESPDERGIDCSLLVRSGKDGFEVEQVRGIRLHFDQDTSYKSRDILYVTGKLRGQRQLLHIFVNHWPSRRGGEAESSANRAVAAMALRKVVDSLRTAENNPLILIMGDFNDEPANQSLAEVLGARQAPLASDGLAPAGDLFNLMGPADARGEGSYNYQGNWNMLDQFVVSAALLPELPCKRCLAVQDGATFQQEWMMFVSERYGATPSRTYGGPNYYGGISDHLPIRLTLLGPR